jgi:predicted amidophosphoribosyltransferase
VPPSFRELRAWGLYRGALLESIHAFKYRRRLSFRGALEMLALQALDANWPGAVFQAAVPVPPHARTLRRRGFDLPTLLARRVARERHIPWRPRALAKVCATADLVGLGAQERARAVEGAYRPRERLRGEVLLLDDVATSGATARACAAACLEAGAEGVCVLVLARTPLNVV